MAVLSVSMYITSIRHVWRDTSHITVQTVHQPSCPIDTMVTYRSNGYLRWSSGATLVKADAHVRLTARTPSVNCGPWRKKKQGQRARLTEHRHDKVIWLAFMFIWLVL